MRKFINSFIFWPIVLFYLKCDSTSPKLRFIPTFPLAHIHLTFHITSSPSSFRNDFFAHLMVQGKSECHFSIRTEQVRFWARYFYNQKELVHFVSDDVGEFRAVNERGRLFAESWNHQKDFVEHNYWIGESFTVQQQVEPTVTVYPAKTQPLQHHNLLVCSVNGFYPGHVEVRWFQNGHEEAGVISTGLIQNGDWTFQTMVMLETVPQSGEVYICQVDHPSQMSPITVEWSDKMMSGVRGFVLGLLFLGIRLFIYFRNQKGKDPVGS
uniref:Ig-like domain-containing protein n=1 Tax=Bos mutus grunniens TaxID=30521 RepID=A0A8B9Y010_BOSMU